MSTKAKRPKKSKPRRTKGTGSLWLRGGIWQYGIIFPNGKRERRSTGVTSKAVAEKMLAARLREYDLVTAGVVSQAEAEIGRQRGRPIEEHLSDWRGSLGARGITEKRIYAAMQRAEDVVKRCGFETLADIDAGAVDTMIGEMTRQGFSPRTVNQRVQAIRQFSRWCVGKGRRLATDPLAGVNSLRVVKATRTRRPLSAEELRLLVAATRTAPPYRRLAGGDRAMLYTLAASTGFRAGELASLTPESFDTAGSPPTVTVQAMYSKRRRDDRQPIPASVVDVVRAWLADKPAGVPLFDLPDKLPPMLHRDLRRARARHFRAVTPGKARRNGRAGFLAPVDQAGRVVDFHALRATYITTLVKAGATVKEAQDLARHSDPRLTLNVYTKLGISDTAAAADRFPDFLSEPKADRPAKGRKAGA